MSQADKDASIGFKKKKKSCGTFYCIHSGTEDVKKRASGGCMVPTWERQQRSFLGLARMSPGLPKEKSTSCCSACLCCGKCTADCISVDKESCAKYLNLSRIYLPRKTLLARPWVVAKYLSQVAVLSSVMQSWLFYQKGDPLGPCF